MSEPTIDIDALVKPVSDAAPGGVSLPDDLRRNLDTWRKEPDPDFPDAAPLPPAEWGKVIDAATTALTRTGKDLTVAVRLVEALTKRHATAGLRDGLLLLEKLAENCWEYTHPIPDDGDDQEARRNRLEWLNNTTAGGKFPGTVLRMPVVTTRRGDKFATADWVDTVRRAAVIEAAVDCTADGLRASMAELVATRQALGRLGTVLDAKMGPESPNFGEDSAGSLGQALGKCIEFVRGLAAAVNVTLDDAPEDAAMDDAPAAGGAVGPVTATAGNRDGVYRQLEQLAAALKRMEPHSPIPYLLERCVKLGRLPFPELMREVISETSTHAELDRLLGIKREE